MMVALTWFKFSKVFFIIIKIGPDLGNGYVLYFVHKWRLGGHLMALITRGRVWLAVY